MNWVVFGLALTSALHRSGDPDPATGRPVADAVVIMTPVRIPGREQPVLTLAEAEQIAVRQAYNVRVAASNALKALQQRRQAQGGLGPKADFTGNYTRFDQRSQFGTNGQGEPVLGAIDSKQFQASVTFPIDITGALRKAVQVAEFNRRAAEESVGTEVNLIKNLVRESYFEILRGEASLNVQQEALTNAQERLDKAKIRLQAGAIAQFDVLRFETDVSRAQAAVIAAQNRIKLAKNNLNELLARPIETEFTTAELPEAPEVAANPDDYVQAAYRTRPDIRAASNIVQAYDLALKTTGSATLPSLSLGATHSYTPDPGFGGRQNQTQATALLTWRFFDSGITKARVEEARQDFEQAKIRLEQTKLGSALEVRQALVRADNAHQTLIVALKTVEQQKETLRVAQLRFDLGEGILLDVTDAQVALTEAQELVITARYEYYSAYAALQKAVGADNLQAALAGETKE